MDLLAVVLWKVMNIILKRHHFIAKTYVMKIKSTFNIEWHICSMSNSCKKIFQIYNNLINFYIGCHLTWWILLFFNLIVLGICYICDHISFSLHLSLGSSNRLSSYHLFPRFTLAFLSACLVLRSKELNTLKCPNISI